MPGYGGRRGGHKSGKRRYHPFGHDDGERGFGGGYGEEGGRGGGRERGGGRGGGGRGRGGTKVKGRISYGKYAQWEVIDLEEKFAENGAQINAAIFKGYFRRNFYVPSEECTSMTKESVKKWMEENEVTVTAGYSESVMKQLAKEKKKKKGTKQALLEALEQNKDVHLSEQSKSESKAKSTHVLEGKIPNPILRFDQVNWHQFDKHNSRNDIRRCLIKKFGEDGKPTPVQAATWPLVLSGLNVIGIAKTGSGKTLSFLLPAIVHVRFAKDCKEGPKALIMLPTRELATQVYDEILKFTYSHTKTCVGVCLTGGEPKRKQNLKLREERHIVVGTPGRVAHFACMTELNLGQVCTV